MTANRLLAIVSCFICISYLACEATSHPGRTHSAYLKLNYKDLRRMIINVGSHADPPVPTDEETAVIAVEPLPGVASNISHIPNRYVLTSAIADYYGITTLNHWMDSSSLLEANPATSGMYASKGEKGAKVLVPVLPFSALLDSLSLLECWFVKTDMQHMDLTAIKSAGHAIKRCHWIFSEVNCKGFTAYLGSENDYDEHWVPYMKEMGFEPSGPSPCLGGAGETNGFFENKNIKALPAPTHDECPKCYT